MQAQSDRLPLVIGVTGHRDLRDQDLGELEQKISAAIAALRRDYLGNDPETPIGAMIRSIGGEELDAQLDRNRRLYEAAPGVP